MKQNEAYFTKAERLIVKALCLLLLLIHGYKIVRFELATLAHLPPAPPPPQASPPSPEPQFRKHLSLAPTPHLEDYSP